MPNLRNGKSEPQGRVWPAWHHGAVRFNQKHGLRDFPQRFSLMLPRHSQVDRRATKALTELLMSIAEQDKAAAAKALSASVVQNP